MVTLIGGNYEWSISYTGLNRELVVDDDNHDLVLHDGVTVGGWRFLNRNNADTRYQTKIAELDGFGTFSPAAKGLLIRLGPANYRLGALESNSANITLTNANGFAGNPSVALASDITSDHTFSGSITFEQEIQATGGINSNSFVGNLVGNTQGVHTGNVTGNATGDHEGSFTGDLDVRGFVAQFSNGQIPIEAIAGLAALVANAIPTGLIAMWAGVPAAIPAGWKLCDGTDGTPNLSDKFIRGHSATTVVGSTGGSLSHTHALTIDAAGNHTHNITVADHTLTESQMPAHRHLNGICDSGTDMFNHGSAGASPTTIDSVDNNSADGVFEGYTTTVGGGQPHNHTASSASSGNHTHPATAANGGSEPPYYSLCFIQKI